MPQSKKRKVAEKSTENQRHVDVAGNTAGKVLIVVLCFAMLAGILIGAGFLIAQYLG